MNEEELAKKLVETFIGLQYQERIDKLLEGNAYWEITDRKIELVNPKNIKVNKNTIIVSNQSEKHKPYGKSLIKPLNDLKGGKETNDKI